MGVYVTREHHTIANGVTNTAYGSVPAGVRPRQYCSAANHGPRPHALLSKPLSQVHSG